MQRFTGKQTARKQVKAESTGGRRIDGEGRAGFAVPPRAFAAIQGSPTPNATADHPATPRLFHDFGRMSLYAKGRGVVQAKLSLGEFNDAHEQEAERIADRILRIPELALQRACSCAAGCPKCRGEQPRQARERPHANSIGSTSSGRSVAPPVVDKALETNGHPLDGATRAFMEPRFDHDFSKVRVHTDALAARSARAIAADAYTVGSDIVFGPGRYAPSSLDGRRLLAHELTHVVQQRATQGSVTAVQRDRPKNAPAKPQKFYQYVIDEIADQEADYARQRQEKKYEFMVHYKMNYKALKALLALAEAVDQARSEDIPKLVDAFIAVDVGPPFPALSQGLLIELVARLFSLGLDAESAKLRDNFSRQEQQWDWIKRDVGLTSRNIAIYNALIERTAAAADNSTTEAAKATMDRYLRILVPLRDEMLSIDEFEKQHDSSVGTRPAPITGKSRWEGLVAALSRLVTAMATSLQSLVDRAASELGSGNPEGRTTLLLIREFVEARILPALVSKDGKTTVGNIKVVLAPTEITKGQGVIRDVFAKDRSVAVRTYTPGQESVRNLEAPVEKVFFQRVDQVATMARIYGAAGVLRADKPAEKERIEDAARNAETLKKVIAAGGKLRLESDDDWRAFVLQKYQDMTGPDAKDKAKALSAIIGLLYDYLGAFTIHARFTDIYDKADFKDAYFNKPFPRTLGGQLVQDCGVYAMRAAYILSLVRSELGLRFRFIRLPAHVGLIITGDGLPMFVAHNNHFQEYSPEKIKAERDAWRAYTEEVTVSEGQGARISVVMAPEPTDEEQFVGELATRDFVKGPLDTPFAMSDVPQPGATGVATQQGLWAEYQKIISKDVFGPATFDKTSPGYLFHNRYLGIMERYREWHDTAVVPFWNEQAPKVWKTLEDALKFKGRTEIPGSELALLLAAHLKQFTEDAKPVKSRLEGIHDSEKAISAQLRGDPKLQAKHARITRGRRIAAQWIYHWDSYRARIEKVLADATARPDAKFGIASVIDPGLKPPFIPVAEKALSKYD
jgi:hypothetical protein